MPTTNDRPSTVLDVIAFGAAKALRHLADVALAGHGLHYSELAGDVAEMATRARLRRILGTLTSTKRRRGPQTGTQKAARRQFRRPDRSKDTVG